MAELTTIARPYAKAVLDYASEKGVESAWITYLARAAFICSDEQMVEVLKNPAVDLVSKMSILADLINDVSVDGAAAFIDSLGRHGRLLAIPAIAKEFERLVASRQETLDITVTSAFPLSGDEVKLLKNKLKTRYAEKMIRLETAVDHTLIGGFEIRSSDTVIDATVKGRLSKITASLAV